MKIYKIRNKNTGMFFKGGHYYGKKEHDHYNWDKAGQTYNSIQGLRRTINDIINYHGILEHIEIVEFALVENSAKPVIDYINPKLVLAALKKVE